MVDTNCFFTVLTPTFNRAHLLPAVYSSLLAQQDNDFEWIIVDDGSTDGTRALVASWQQGSAFPIRYIYQPNSGKHVAINRGVAAAQGSLLVVVDSDDALAPGALKSIREAWLSIPEGQRGAYAGVAGLCVFKDGKIVGSPFPKETLDADNVELRSRYRVKGDKFEVYRVDVLRDFPFPENLGPFVTEALIWNRIARKYLLRCMNAIWCYKEYYPDGLTAKSVLLRMKYPFAAALYYKELLNWQGSGLTPAHRLRAAVNFNRFSMHQGKFWTFWRDDMPHRFVRVITWPIGVLLYLRDRLSVWCLGRMRCH